MLQCLMVGPAPCPLTHTADPTAQKGREKLPSQNHPITITVFQLIKYGANNTKVMGLIPTYTDMYTLNALLS